MNKNRTEQEIYKRYGKPSAALLNIKTSFFEKNDLHLKKQRKGALIYKKQKKRTCCKNCNDEIDKEFDFIKDGIGYILCRNCNHLNGAYEDTNEFCEALYTDDEGSDYAKTYTESNLDDFNHRTTSIYMPKAEFLYTSLVNDNIDPHDLSYIDFGAGSVMTWGFMMVIIGVGVLVGKKF